MLRILEILFCSFIIIFAMLFEMYMISNLIHYIQKWIKKFRKLCAESSDTGVKKSLYDNSTYSDGSESPE